MRTVSSIVLAAIALCSCGSPAPPTPSAVPPPAVVQGGPQRLDRRPTWLSKQVKKNRKILFVSDGVAGDVYLYRLPDLTLLGRITGFAQPQGLCAGKEGAVWVTDANARLIYELSHAGTLLAKLSDATGYPEGCAWDPKTGNLAVMNLFGLGTTAGSVLIYGPGSSSPVTYQNPKQYYYNFGGYDAGGNLFFDGRSAIGRFMLSELPAGAGTAKTIKVDGSSIFFPGMVQWDSSSGLLIVGDQQCGNVDASCVYQLTIAGNHARISSQIRLLNLAGQSVCDLVQGVVAGGQLMGSDNDFCGSTPSATYLWPYPSGGRPIEYAAGTAVTPVGAALSLK